MPSATIRENIGGSIQELLVLYPRFQDQNMTNAELVRELIVIRNWFITFNGNGVDINNKHPSTDTGGSYPAYSCIVQSTFHISNYSPNERIHITTRIGTSADWQSSPKRNTACIHIYAKNNNLNDGYESYKIENKKASELKSPAIVKSIQDALADNRGTLVGNQLKL